MKPLTRKIWSHESIDTKLKQYVRDIRQSRPKIVRSFRTLVKEVAKISFNNPDLAIFYRGQRKEHFVKEGYASAYPSILRNIKSSRKSRLYLNERYDILNKGVELLLDTFHAQDWDGLAVIDKFPEVSWAILQHYEICDTPLLDLTSSLRVACSFALRHEDNSGIIYVFGFPHTNGSISYYADEELINLRLLNICPPIAMRPHYQEGYLVGTFPTKEIKRRKIEYDISRRLIAKFRILKGSFWNSSFHEIPEDALFPNSDKMEGVAREIHQELRTWCSNKGFQSMLLPSRD
ncbi:FRG domain-containing protein [Thiolapillus sp.]